MSAVAESDSKPHQLSDYSLVGVNSKLAVEKGLAEAEWYQSPVPRDVMRQLLERKNGPAIRDTIIWFGLLGLFGYAGFLLWPSAWAHPWPTAICATTLFPPATRCGLARWVTRAPKPR